MARKSKSPSDMSSLIHSKKGTLAHITEKTNYLSILTNIVRQTCPDLPQDVWHIANFNDKSVTIEVNTSVWGQRLQFERMKISQKLAEITQGQYTQIKIKVSPNRSKVFSSPNTPTQSTATPSFSQQTGEEFKSIAQKAPKGLKEKLEKLAQHANKK